MTTATISMKLDADTGVLRRCNSRHAVEHGAEVIRVRKSAGKSRIGYVVMLNRQKWLGFLNPVLRQQLVETFSAGALNHAAKIIGMTI